MPIVLLRSTQISSPDDTHDAYGPNRFRRTMLEERKITLFGNGEETRDHIMVQDVAQIIYLCLLHRSQGLLNVATGRSLTFSEIANIVASHHTPLPTIDCMPREVELTHRSFDPSLLKQMFPEFQFTPFEKGEADIQRQCQDVFCSDSKQS